MNKLNWLNLARLCIVLMLMSCGLSRADQPKKPVPSAPTIPPAEHAILYFPTYKGITYPWGSDKKGNSTYERWLARDYDPQTVARDINLLLKMKIRTLSLWLWLDRFIVKDQNWGTPAYQPHFDSHVVAHWENLLRQLRVHHITTIVNLYNRCSFTDPFNRCSPSFDPRSYFQTAALVPVRQDNTLLGPGIANGDMSVSRGNMPTGWQAIGTGSVTFFGHGGTPGGERYLRLQPAQDGSPEDIRTPLVQADPTKLLAATVLVKGTIETISLEYFDSRQQKLDQDTWSVRHDFGETWTPLTVSSRQESLPAVSGKVAIRVRMSGRAHAGYVGLVQLGAGQRSALWQNYLAVTKAWVERYSSKTTFGRAINGWQGFKEGYTNVPWAHWGGFFPLSVLHDFYHDLYIAIHTSGTTQPVGMDSVQAANSILTPGKDGKLINLHWYQDVADYYNIHLYNDTGSIPAQVSLLNKPWILGEIGASNAGETFETNGHPHYSNPRLPYEKQALLNFLRTGRKLGARAVLAWSFTANPALIQFKNGQPEPGPAGQVYFTTPT